MYVLHVIRPRACEETAAPESWSEARHRFSMRGSPLSSMDSWETGIPRIQTLA
jgi:hypothetical protein